MSTEKIQTIYKSTEIQTIYKIDNNEFRVYITDKDYIMIKHIEPNYLKKYVCEFADKSTNFTLIDNNNKTIHRYIMDCFEEKAFTMTEKQGSTFKLIGNISTKYTKPGKIEFFFTEKPVDDFDTLEMECEKCEKQIKIEREEHNQLKEEHNQLKEEHNKLNENHSKLKEDHVKLNEEYYNLRGKYNMDIHVITHQENSKYCKIKHLENKYCKLEAEHNKLKEENNKLKEEHTQLNEIRNKIFEESCKQYENFEKQIQIQREENNQLKEENTQLNENHLKLSEENNRLTDMIKKTDETYKKLTAELYMVKGLIYQLKQELRQQEKDFENDKNCLKNEYNELQKKNDELQEKYEVQKETEIKITDELKCLESALEQSYKNNEFLLTQNAELYDKNESVLNLANKIKRVNTISQKLDNIVKIMENKKIDKERNQGLTSGYTIAMKSMKQDKLNQENQDKLTQIDF